MRVFFFTGTGNSYWASKKIGAMANAEGKPCSVIPIDGLDPRGVDPPAGGTDELTGFIYPTHGFSLPWFMLRFIFLFPAGRGSVFLVNNRAGMKMGKIFTPGLSGIAVILPMLILAAKGYRIIGTLPLDTPSNWISIHPGLRSHIIDSIFERRERDVAKLWSRIGRGKYFFPAKFFIFLPLDLLVIQVSLAYMLFGRFILARSYVPDTSCDGCGICAQRCPVGAIRMHGKNPYWTHRCESCMRCSNICPKVSINSSVPLMILYTWVIMGISSYSGLFNFLWVRINMIVSPLDQILYYAFLWTLIMLLVYVQYIVVYLLRRFKPFNRIITYTTPVKFWRRYMAPGFRGRYDTPAAAD